jgi:hypothetical protein
MDGQTPSGFTESSYYGMDNHVDSSSNTDEVEEDDDPIDVREMLRMLDGQYRSYRKDVPGFDGFSRSDTSRLINEQVSRYRKQSRISLM